MAKTPPGSAGVLARTVFIIDIHFAGEDARAPRIDILYSFFYEDKHRVKPDTISLPKNHMKMSY